MFGLSRVERIPWLWTRAAGQVQSDILENNPLVLPGLVLIIASVQRFMTERGLETDVRNIHAIKEAALLCCFE